MAQKDDKKKKEQLGRAKTDIAVMYGYYPDLGGEKWKQQYDTVLQSVQKALGERPLGLAGLKGPEAPPPATKGGAPAAKGSAAPAASKPASATNSTTSAKS